jgi:hypothetical protein
MNLKLNIWNMNYAMKKMIFYVLFLVMLEIIKMMTTNFDFKNFVDTISNRIIYEKEFNFHKYKFMSIGRSLKKRFMSDFEKHRTAMAGVLSKIGKIKWVVIEKDQYERLFCKKDKENNIHSLLMSRYSHRTLDECYPNSNECIECYKYHCFHCGEGTNCMYGGCCSESRCSSNINLCIENIKNPKKIYILHTEHLF